MLCPADPLWQDCLRAVRQDIYHGAGYHAFEEHLGHGEAYLAVIEEGARRLAWPYLLRLVGKDRGHTDVTSVYGYPGPLGLGVAPGDPFIDAAWIDLRRLWSEQGAVTAFTRFNPLLGNAALAECLEVNRKSTGHRTASHNSARRSLWTVPCPMVRPWPPTTALCASICAFHGVGE